MATDPPRREGEHPIYGIFIGGDELDDTYHLTGTRHYWFMGQRHDIKVINFIEQALAQNNDSNDTIKFNSNAQKKFDELTLGGL